MSKVKFTANGKELAQALQRLQALIGTQIPGGVHFSAHKNQQLECQANLNGRRALVLLPAKVEHPGQFIVQKSELEAVCKNRAELQFTLQESGLHFTANKYTGRLALNPLPDNLQLLSFKQTDNIIPAKLQVELLAAMRKCQLQNVYGTERLTLFIQIHDNCLYVGVADLFHAGLVALPIKDKYKKLPIFAKPILLPLEYSNILTTQFKSTGVQFNIQTNLITFADSTSMLELPALQTQSAPLDNLLAIEAGTTYKIEAEELKTVLQSCTLANVDLTFRFKAKQPQLQIKFKGEHTEIADSIAIDPAPKTDHKLRLDVKNLLDVVRKLDSGAVQLAFNKSMVKLTQADTSYFSQLLQKDNKDDK